MCESWHLGYPPYVIPFFERDDIPEDSKDRVEKSVEGFLPKLPEPYDWILDLYVLPNLPEPYDSISDFVVNLQFELEDQIAKELARLDKARGHLGAPE